MQKKVRDILIEGFQEREEPFFYLAPDIIGSVSNANMDTNKNLFTIEFNTTDGRQANLELDSDYVHNFFNENENENSNFLDLVKHFIGNSEYTDSEYGENLEEIVDEYGDIIGDDDEGPFGHIGSSKFDSDKTVKQTIAKSRRDSNTTTIGTVVW